uniref:ribosomal RNA small subunit methyltransferase H isoform X2 n=1 Tax=Erigeron canadensis TaxID=72917 RepID=UPI001CB931DA|nr:ribosomal RNA small subunit methyltransferase H isoform X2 [Erigeron canadensis]
MTSHTITAAVKHLLFHSSLTFTPSHFRRRRHISSSLITLATYSTTLSSTRNKKKLNRKDNSISNNNRRLLIDSAVKRRTRSDKKFDEESFRQFGDTESHIPVMLGEVLEVFDSVKLHAFVDCTLGAAGHSSAVIRAHPEMQSYVGLDCDPIAHEKAKAKIDLIRNANSHDSSSNLRTHTFLRNFKNIKSTISEVDEKLLISGVDGILMDLGMSSMQVNNSKRGFSVLCDGPLDMRMDPQASLTAEDILNSWPEAEIGQILRDYGEENNWRALQKRIVKARLSGGLHSTSELVDLIRSSTPGGKGRQGWIKTATRVFQALRIAVNDELKTLEASLYDCYSCLAPGGRLAVISFHSLEDRIVKQTFLSIINQNSSDGHDREAFEVSDENEPWIKQMIHGVSGTILTKRPITPSEDEEKLNVRCRSAKLRVIQKD